VISTIDVHGSICRNEESDFEESSEPYGKHRFIFERWCRNTFKNCLIVRLPALFGVGLKKNCLFDLLENREISVHPNSEFQWYDLNWLKEDIGLALALSLHTANFYSEPVRTQEIVDRFFPFRKCLGTSLKKYNHGSSMFYRSKDKVMDAMEDFISLYKLLKNPSPRWCCSNLCWGKDDDLAIRCLKRYGITNVELAPTLYGSWETLNAVSIKDKWEGARFKIVSLQSVLYGIGVDLKTSKCEVIKHLKEIVNPLAVESGASVVVFGNPKLRKSPASVEDLIDVLKEVANDKITYCLEPNAPEYECQIGTTLAECLAVVQQINDPNVKLNYDSGNSQLVNDFCTDEFFPYIGHIQLSEPCLKNLTTNKKLVPDVSGYVSMEVLGSIENLAQNLRKFVLNF
jgi:hypothetical protein